MFLVSLPLFAFLLEEEIIALSYLFFIIITFAASSSKTLNNLKARKMEVLGHL